MSPLHLRRSSLESILTLTSEKIVTWIYSHPYIWEDRHLNLFIPSCKRVTLTSEKIVTWICSHPYIWEDRHLNLFSPLHLRRSSLESVHTFIKGRETFMSWNDKFSSTASILSENSIFSFSYFTEIKELEIVILYCKTFIFSETLFSRANGLGYIPETLFFEISNFLYLTPSLRNIGEDFYFSSLLSHIFMWK